MAVDLSKYDDDFPKSLAGGELKSLPDGHYSFAVVSAKARQSANGATTILEMEISVIGGECDGNTYKWPMFISDKESLGRVGRELKKLGFDVENWVPGTARTFSSEFNKVPKTVKGIHFSADKKQNGDFANLNNVKRLLTDGRPEVLGEAELNAPDPTIPF